MKVADTTYKVHLDGYNLLPLLTGQTKESPRKEFYYFNDDSELVGLRYDNWKFVFQEQRVTGTLQIWGEPFTTLRFPKLFNLRTDPFERADITSNTYYDWRFDHAFICSRAAHRRRVPRHVQGVPAQTEGGQLQLGPRMKKLAEGAAGGSR